jgi:hypothetical protein
MDESKRGALLALLRELAEEHRTSDSHEWREMSARQSGRPLIALWCMCGAYRPMVRVYQHAEAEPIPDRAAEAVS